MLGKESGATMQKERTDKMKKLIIATCAMAFATVVQAATINWGSGYLKSPASAESGTASGTYLGQTVGSWTATLYIYSDSSGSTQVAYDTVTMTVTESGGTKSRAFTQGANDKDAAGTIASTFATPAGIKVTGASWNALELNTTYYAKVIISGETADYTATKESGLMSFTTKSSALSAVDVGSANAAKWPTTYLNGAWAVTPKELPEPTSAMLMLLGMAGLALRRKRA